MHPQQKTQHQQRATWAQDHREYGWVRGRKYCLWANPSLSLRFCRTLPQQTLRGNAIHTCVCRVVVNGEALPLEEIRSRFEANVHMIREQLASRTVQALFRTGVRLQDLLIRLDFNGCLSQSA